MEISPEGKIGIALGLLGLGGAGALFVLPHPWSDYVGWSLIAIAGAGLLVLACHHFGISFLIWRRHFGERPPADPTKKFPPVLAIEWSFVFISLLAAGYLFSRLDTIKQMPQAQARQAAQGAPALKQIGQSESRDSPTKSRDLFAHVALLFDEDRRDYTVLEQSENVTTVAIENTLPSQFSYSTVFGVSYSITIAFYGADTPLDIHIIANPRCRGGMLEFQSPITYNISAQTLRYVEISAHSGISLTCAAGSHKVNILFYTDTK
jgi:hypothetical protein